MGTFIETIKEWIPCVESEREKNEKNLAKELEEATEDIDIILKNEIYCTKCEENPPHMSELLSLHSDTDILEYICTKNMKFEDTSILEYYDKNSKKIKCNGCEEYDNKRENNKKNEVNKNVNDEMDKDKNKYIYCTYDKKFYCGECKLTRHLAHDQKYRHYDVKELSSMCIYHNKKADICCKECRINVCSVCYDMYHKRHKKGNNNSSKDIFEARQVTLEKAKNLNLMKQFYQLMVSAYESNSDNTIYQQNLANVAECIEKEKKRDKYERELAIYKIEQDRKNIKID